MSGDESSEQAAVPDDGIVIEGRSMFSCCAGPRGCGALLYEVDVTRHRHWHGAMTRALEDARR